MKVGFFVCLVGLVGLVGCSSVTKSQSTVDYSAMRQIVERMDSMTRVSQREYMLQIGQISQKVDSVKSSEVRDTSHTIFLGAKGDTVREIITIKEIIEREHMKHENTQEYLEERFRQTDSLLQVAIEKQTEIDSVLQSYHKETVFEKETTFGDKLKWFAGGIVLTIIGCIVMKNRS
jgi:hypothetical protein